MRQSEIGYTVSLIAHSSLTEPIIRRPRQGGV